MDVFAAVTTGKGTGPIATIQLFGEKAQAVLKKIFKPASSKPATFELGQILLGTITDGAETIDHVIIGCEGPGNFAINCHGNPLIVADIMQLLKKSGVKLLTAEQLLAKILSAKKGLNTIAIEAKLAMPKAKTLEGTRIIANQIGNGLNKKANQWLQDIASISLDEIRAEAMQILEISRTAKLIINGCTAVLVGPPNSGKSTLLNRFAGRQKAIVTDIKGTTRDWVSARCQFGPVSVELIDTAGLGEEPTAGSQNAVDKTAQRKSVELLEEADLVLLVLDSSQTAAQLDEKLVKKITSKLVLSEAEGKVLAVLNKSDLPIKLDISKLPAIFASTTQKISAKFGNGVGKLSENIVYCLGTADFNLQSPVCFTSRQENLLKQLKKAKSRKQAVSIITELLNGEVRV